MSDAAQISANITQGTIVTASVAPQGPQGPAGATGATGAGANDATTGAKGIVQLAGDLGGTAASPTTPTAVHLTGNETITGSKTFSATTNLTNVNMQGNITGTAQKKIILTANDATGSVSRLVEYHATNIVDRPWQSWFDQNNRQVVASGAHDTLPASEGGNQLKQFEIKTVADATGSNPTELRTRFAIQYDVQRGTWGVNYIDNFEINQGENPILTTPGSATQFGLKLRTAPQDTLSGTVPNAVIGTFTAQLDASDNAFGFLDIMPPYQSGGTLFPGNKTATLNIFRNTNSASSSSPVIAIKKGDGTNTTNITLNAKQGSITTVGAINGVGLDAGSQKITSVATPTVSTDAATKGYVDTHVGGTYFNVKSYGAVGDGSNDDTSAIQSAVTAALATSRGTAAVYFPAGTYKITSTINATSATVSASGKGVYLVGDGHEASQIFKNSSFGPAVTWNGNGGPSGNCSQFGGMLNMTINGNATTGGLVQTNSAQQMTFDNCSFIGSNDVAWDFNTMQDSYFSQCTFNNCGSTTKPVINIYGSSSGTSNMLWFSQLRVETFLNGAVWIKRGAGATGGGNNGFFFSQCKLENFPTVNGDVFVADGYTQQLIMDQIFISIGQYNTAYSTPANGIVFGDGTTGSGLNQASFTNIFMNAGPTANIGNSVLNIKGASGMTGPVVIENVYADTTMNTAALIVNGATNMGVKVGRVAAASGTTISTDGTTGLGTSGQVWTSNGTSALPSWQSAGGGLGSGVVTASNLAGSGTSGSLTTISTASITPAANSLILLAVSIRNSTTNPTITSVTGNGLTWVSVGSVNFKTSGSRRSIFLYRAMGSAPTTGAVTVNFGETETDVSWSVDQLSGVNTSGTNGSGAIAQSVTAVDSAGSNSSLATALSTFSSSLNATYAVFGTDGAATPVAGTGTALLGHGNATTNITTDSEFVSGVQTAPSMSWGASAFMGALALEIKAATVSSRLSRIVNTLSTTATLGANASTDYVYLLASGAVPTLPTAVGNSNLYTIKNVDSTNKTLATTSAQTIDGSASATLTPNTSLDLISNGSNWVII